MRKIIVPAAVLLCLLLLVGCSDFPNTDVTDTLNADALDTADTSKLDAIPFVGDQLYAVAYLGYGEIGEFSFYAENYLYNESLPIHYISGGEYYLIIPRYADMAMRLYWNDMETSESVLIYEEPESRPFIIQCNVSDIFSDITIQLTHETETVEFSPYISLQDGSVVVGDRGLNITHTPQ